MLNDAHNDLSILEFRMMLNDICNAVNRDAKAESTMEFTPFNFSVLSNSSS